MARTIVYQDYEFSIDDGITLEQAKNSMMQIFPEIKGAVLLEKDGKIHIVLEDRMRQNMLDMELMNAKMAKHQRELEAKLERKRHHAETRESYGWFKGSKSNKEAEKARKEVMLEMIQQEEWRRECEMRYNDRISITANELRKQYLESQEAQAVEEFAYIIGDEYAVRGGYEHLVGKKAKILETNEELGVHLVKVQDDDSQYVIRKQDVKQI